MPLHGVNHSDIARGDVQYFKCLADLDAWASKPRRKLDGVLRYVARRPDTASDNRGKLLVIINSMK